MDDDEIDDWLDSSDDEAGEAPGATPQPSTPSFLAETTPDSTPAREAVAAAPAEEAPEAPAVAEAPAGVEAARAEAPAVAPPAPPSVPTPSAVSVEPPARAVETAVEPASPVAEEMTVLSLSSPKAANLPSYSRTGKGAPSLDGSPKADAYVSLEDSFQEKSFPAEGERVPGEPGANSASPSIGFEETRTTTTETAYVRDDVDDMNDADDDDDDDATHPRHESLDGHGATLDSEGFGGGDGEMDTAWTMRRGGVDADETDVNFMKNGFGFGSLIGASLGSVTAAVKAAAQSDLARDALESAKGVGKELGTLAKHVAGEDLAAEASASSSGGEIPETATMTVPGSVTSSRATATPNTTRVEETQTGRDDDDDLWSAFGLMAKRAAKSLETAAAAVATDPNVRRVASRSAAAAKKAIAAVESQAFDFLEKTIDADGSRAFAEIADADGVLLETALIERGCAAHLETLETLADAADMIAAEAWHETENEDAEWALSSAFHPDVLDKVDAALNVELVNAESVSVPETFESDVARAGGCVPGEDASTLSGSMRADAEFAARDAAAKALETFLEAFVTEDGSSSVTDLPSPESIEAALRASLEQTRRESAARVADVAAAAVAHLADVAAALETSGAWPSPSYNSTGEENTTTTPASIALARVRLIGARVRAMAADADGVADVFAAATTSAFSHAVFSDADSESRGITAASLFPDPEARAAFAALAEKHATNTAARLKEVSMGYAADAARCLRAAVAASAEDAAAAAPRR